MTFDDLQSEINCEANQMGAEVFLGLWDKIKNIHLDANSYINLITIYTHLKIYYQHLKRKTREYSLSSDDDGAGYRSYNHCLNTMNRIEIAFRQMKWNKQSLRETLTEKGIRYKDFHPHQHRLDLSKIPQQMFSQKNIDLC